MDLIYSLLDQILAMTSFPIEQKWYPLVIIGIVLVLLLVVYIVFAFVRAFLSWLWRVDDAIDAQRKNNRLLAELLDSMEVLINQHEEMIDILQVQQDLQRKSLETRTAPAANDSEKKKTPAAAPTKKPRTRAKASE